MSFKVIFAVVIIGSFMTTANANWLHQKKESAFGADDLELIVTMSGAMGFGVRCSPDSVEALFITNDRSFDDETLLIANATNPKLLLRIDSEPSLTLSAKLWDNDGTITAIAEVDLELIDSIAGANTRIAVAMRLLGETYHETNFSVLGSTKAANKLKDGCVEMRSAS